MKDHANGGPLPPRDLSNIARSLTDIPRIDWHDILNEYNAKQFEQFQATRVAPEETMDDVPFLADFRTRDRGLIHDYRIE